MKATLLDLRRNLGKILEAIERNETVTLSNRGREIAYIVPKKVASQEWTIREEPAFGMWKNREDMADPAEYVREMRKGRFRDL